MPVLFEASWCPFCRMFRPVFESYLEEKGIQFSTMDLSDYENPLWDSFHIDIVPTVIVFREGKPVTRWDGVPGRGLSEEIVDEIVRQVGVGQTAFSG